MTRSRECLLFRVTDWLHSRKFLGFSVACNVALAIFLLLLVNYSRGGSSVEGRVPEQLPILETVTPRSDGSFGVMAETAASAVPGSPRGAKAGGLDPDDPKVVPDWKTLDFPLYPWRAFVFEVGDPQKLSALTTQTLAMSPEEVAVIEGLASRLAGKLEELNKIHVVGENQETVDDLPPMVHIPEAELDALCESFSQGASDCLGSQRGRVLADAVLLSRSFLIGAYSDVRRSYRIRKWNEEFLSKAPDAFSDYCTDHLQLPRMSPSGSGSRSVGDLRFYRTYRGGQ